MMLDAAAIYKTPPTHQIHLYFHIRIHNSPIHSPRTHYVKSDPSAGLNNKHTDVNKSDLNPQGFDLVCVYLGISEKGTVMNNYTRTQYVP